MEGTVGTSDGIGKTYCIEAKSCNEDEKKGISSKKVTSVDI